MGGTEGIRPEEYGAAVRIQRGAVTWASRLEPYLWVFPAVALYCIFFVYPLYFGVALSLSNWSGITPIEQIKWAGLENYRELLRDPIFLLALRNSVVWALVTTVAYSILAFILAFVLWYRSPRAAGFLRSFIFYPSVLSTVILALAWFRIYALDGLMNTVLSGVLGRPVETMWLANVNLSYWAVMWTDIWKGTGWTMVLFLAGMSAISDELVDSARVEGANSFQVARYIAEPLIRHASGLAVLINIIGGLQIFGPVWVLTRGGPVHSTEVLATYSFYHAFFTSRMGYAGAVTMVGVIILFVVSVIRVRTGRLA